MIQLSSAYSQTISISNSAPNTAISWPAVATLLAAIIATSVAWRQYANARTKLKLDLFEKRFPIYQAAEAFVFGVVADPSVPIALIHTFNAATTEARFLFRPSTNEYLDGLRNHALELRMVNARISNPATVPPDELTRLIERDEALLKVFSEAQPKMQKIFGEYLSIPHAL